jgi:hypothetical protein
MTLKYPHEVIAQPIEAMTRSVRKMALATCDGNVGNGRGLCEYLPDVEPLLMILGVRPAPRPISQGPHLRSRHIHLWSPEFGQRQLCCRQRQANTRNPRRGRRKCSDCRRSGTQGISGAAYNSEERTRQSFVNAGASFNLLVVQGADHKLDHIEAAIQQAGSVSIAEKAAQFFGLLNQGR